MALKAIVSDFRTPWFLLASRSGRALLRGVCALMVRRLEKAYGPPAVESVRGIVRLWRIEEYRQVALRRESVWILDDGRPLHMSDPVLELHIDGARLWEALRSARAPWRQIMAEEFQSLVPLLTDRREVAIVGSTILGRQAASFGASVRDAPSGLYSSLDGFYRRLILLAFHPGGAARVVSERQPLIDAAISIEAFRARFSGDERGGLAQRRSARSSSALDIRDRPRMLRRRASE